MEKLGELKNYDDHTLKLLFQAKVKKWRALSKDRKVAETKYNQITSEYFNTLFDMGETVDEMNRRNITMI